MGVVQCGGAVQDTQVELYACLCTPMHIDPPAINGSTPVSRGLGHSNTQSLDLTNASTNSTSWSFTGLYGTYGGINPLFLALMTRSSADLRLMPNTVATALVGYCSAG